jgi:hypothetical protein
VRSKQSKQFVRSTPRCFEESSLASPSPLTLPPSLGDTQSPVSAVAAAPLAPAARSRSVPNAAAGALRVSEPEEEEEKAAASCRAALLKSHGS